MIPFSSSGDSIVVQSVKCIDVLWVWYQAGWQHSGSGAQAMGRKW